MNKPINREQLIALFQATQQAPETRFPFPQAGLTIPPEEINHLNTQLTEAFKVKCPHAFVMDGAHQ